jgi:hypothetical protein
MSLIRPQSAISKLSTSLLSSRPFTTLGPAFKVGEDWKGRGADEHLVNQKHEHNIFEESSKKGQRSRAEDLSHDGDSTNSQATSQKTTSTAKEAESQHGKKDRGMGLQDERGGVSWPMRFAFPHLTVHSEVDRHILRVSIKSFRELFARPFVDRIEFSWIPSLLQTQKCT